MKLKTFINHLEFNWYILVMLLLIGGFVPLWMGMTGRVNQIDEGNELIRSLLIIAYGVSLLPLIFIIPEVLNVIYRTPLLWILVFWSFLSFLWSNFPALTLRRSISLLLATLFGIILYLKYSINYFLKLMKFVLIIVMLGSILLILFKPDWGIMEGSHEGAWRGILTHKNLLGIASLAALITFSYTWKFRKGVVRLIHFGLILTSLIVLIFSRSLTTYIIAGILVGSVISIRLARKLRRQWPIYAIFIVGLLIIIFFTIFTNYPSLLRVIGRDITLTGRIPLWKAVIPYIKERPILGYGYRSFWLASAGPSLNVWKIVGWNAPHAHNGYIDIWIQLGLIGLLLCMSFIIDFAITTVKIIVLVDERENTLHYEFIALIGIFIFLYNLSESTILQSTANHAFYWVLLVYLYSYIKITPISKQKKNIHEIKHIKNSSIPK